MTQVLPVPAQSQRGFTLMEVLIAVTITAVIGLGVWQVINGIVSSRDRVNELADDFDRLQRTMLLLERDLVQIVNRPARDVYGDFQPALTSRDEEFVLLLTRQGWRNPLGIRRSELQRVGWEFIGNELHRRYWPTVDQGQEDSSEDVLLLSGVTDVSVRFLNDQRTWLDDWPTTEKMAALDPDEVPDTGLPIGLEVTIEHEVFGTLVRTFALPDFDSDEAQTVVSASQAASVSEDDEDDDEEDQ